VNCKEIREFQIAQQEIVAMIGAFLTSLNNFSDAIPDTNSEEIDLVSVRRLQTIASDIMSKVVVINQFCNKYHYPTYFKELVRSVTRIITMLEYQTLPSKKLDAIPFKDQFLTHIGGISEVMIAIAQIVTPSIDANIKAKNAFSAYCFISSIIAGTTSEIIIVDPYIDQSIFYRYLFRLPKEIIVKIVTDKDKLAGDRLREFESVEYLFKSEYTNYTRKLRDALHDRYLIIDVNAYSLGGSIKDAARKSDFSIVQLSEDKKTELCAMYS